MEYSIQKVWIFKAISTKETIKINCAIQYIKYFSGYFYHVASYKTKMVAGSWVLGFLDAQSSWLVVLVMKRVQKANQVGKLAI